MTRTDWVVVALVVGWWLVSSSEAKATNNSTPDAKKNETSVAGASVTGPRGITDPGAGQGDRPVQRPVYASKPVIRLPEMTLTASVSGRNAGVVGPVLDDGNGLTFNGKVWR